MSTNLTNQNLYNIAKYLQDLLIDQATDGRGTMLDPSAPPYPELRTDLIQNPKTKAYVPDFVKKSRDLSAFWSFIRPKYRSYEERRVFIRESFAPLLDRLEQLAQNPVDLSVTVLLQRFSPEEIQSEWQKALTRQEFDPEGAITMARTILESVCKHILDDRNIPYTKSMDLPKLYRQVSESLKLAPEQHSDVLFKQILGGCSSVVEGLGSVRNSLSDAHGKGRKPVKPGRRHAELAVNLAGSMSTFLIRTHQEQKPGS